MRLWAKCSQFFFSELFNFSIRLPGRPSVTEYVYIFFNLRICGVKEYVGYRVPGGQGVGLQGLRG